MESYRIIKRYLLTEKSTLAKEKDSKYFFEVDPRANKVEIKEAVERFFKAKVEDVHVMNVPGKKKRFGRRIGQTKPWKKAIVTLVPGAKIEIFKGV